MTTMHSMNSISARVVADVVIPRGRRMSWHFAVKKNQTGKQEGSI